MLAAGCISLGDWDDPKEWSPALAGLREGEDKSSVSLVTVDSS